MRPIDNLVQEVIACYREHFALIYNDILNLPKRKSLLVEGAALLPSSVASVLTNRSHAIWMIASADFQRVHYLEREWAREIVSQCNNPKATFHNWMERDIRVGPERRRVFLKMATRSLSLPVLTPL
jgi:hypothetical protein